MHGEATCEKDGGPSPYISVERGTKGKRKILRNLLNEYSRSSTLHGLRYITERKLSVYEKIFWLITFLMSVSVCIVVIINLYIKWQSNPVIVTINENVVSASKIPFPSITICPQTKCRVSVFNYTAARKESESFFRVLSSLIGKRKKRAVKNSSLQKFSDIATVCEGNDVITNKLKIYNRIPSTASLVYSVQEVAEPLNNIFFRCIWRGQKTDCGHLFKRVLTREGVCYNMNAMAVGNILNLDNVQNDYNYMDTHVKDKDGIPRAGRINGAGPDLDIILKRNVSDRDLSCNTLNDGYKIYMQTPEDLPSTSLYHYTALDSQATSLAIKCNIFNTSVDLKQNSAEERQCYFQGERNLSYFSTYTAHNCWLECLSTYMFKECGCVGFYLPHKNSSQLCSFGTYKCIIRAEEKLADMEASGNTSIDCNCLPACYSIDYTAEVTMSGFNYKTLWEIEYEGRKFDNSFQYSRIVLFFQQSGYVAMRRSKLFGWIDFIANCGGLLGLFLGFSVLSIVEIMYYITLRFWCSAESDPKKEKMKSIDVFNIA